MGAISDIIKRASSQENRIEEDAEIEDLRRRLRDSWDKLAGMLGNSGFEPQGYSGYMKSESNDVDCDKFKEYIEKLINGSNR